MTRDNKIKDYVTLVRPSFWRFIFQLFTAIIAYVTVPVAAIFAAKAIVSLTVGDFKQAIIWLGVEAGLHILRQMIWSVNYKGQGRLFADNYRKVQNKIFDKVTDATTDSLRGVGREKILNGVNSDADALASFTDTIATQLSKAVQLGITFVIILTYNVWVALLLLVLGVADYFILGYLNKRYGKEHKRFQESKDSLYENMNDVYTSHSLISELEAKDIYKQQYNARVENTISAYKKRLDVSDLRDNWNFAFYRTVIFFITCFLIWLLTGQTISLETYLVVTPYLLTCTELIVNLINIGLEVEKVDVSTKRIDAILSMSTEDLAAFGKIRDYSDSQDLSVVNVSYKCDNKSSPYFGEIRDADLSFKYNEFNLVKGAKRSGKRLLFFLLTKKIKPQSGVILIDGVDIFAYNKKSFRKQMYYLTSKPQFLNTSIKTNLELMSKNKSKITKMLKKVGLFDKIQSLSRGIDTNVYEAGFDEFEMYLLNIVRAFLVESSCVAIYEYPNTLDENEKRRLYELFESYSGKKTIIMFTAKHDFDKLSKMTYIIDRGQVSWRV